MEPLTQVKATSDIEIIVVGTGRDGTVSLTKWFNDLFELNKIKKNAVHEPYSRESYNAYSHFLNHSDDAEINEIIKKIAALKANVMVGNGYASILPYLASISTIKTLIHIKRKKEECVESLVKNAHHFKSAYSGYVEDVEAHLYNKARRITAVDMKETSNDDWNKLTITEKLSWYYDYTHKTINNHQSLFGTYLEIKTEDLNDHPKMMTLANNLFGNVVVPYVPKLNSHEFIDIKTFDQDYKHYIQWLLGQIDWKKVATDPSYLALYAINRFETWIGWCETNHINITVCEKNYMDKKQIKNLLNKVLPEIQKSINNLNKLR